jgi:hypothetical protein
MERAMASLASALVWKAVRQTLSDLRVLKKVSTTALSKQFPFPDIETKMPCCLSSA